MRSETLDVEPLVCMSPTLILPPGGNAVGALTQLPPPARVQYVAESKIWCGVGVALSTRERTSSVTTTFLAVSGPPAGAGREAAFVTSRVMINVCVWLSG